MRGEVISVDGISGDGLISGDDGQRYSFLASASRSAVRAGDKVDFVPGDGVATDIMRLGGDPAYSGLGSMPPRSSASSGIDWGRLFWSAEGRIRRSHFWAAWGIIFAVNLLLGWIPLIGFLIGLVLIWPSIAIQTKRLHDMGKTGWLQLAPIGVWIVAIIIGASAMGFAAIGNPGGIEDGDPAAVFAMMGPMVLAVIVAMLAGLGYLIWSGAAEGQPGRNQYGTNPKNPVDDTADTFA
jgi:uncharacterized membrane protein YhaH (DUF805 family)